MNGDSTMALQIRRGYESERSSIPTALKVGELVWTRDQQQLWVGVGIDTSELRGGVNILASSAGTGLHWNSTTNKLELAAVTYTTDNIAPGTNPDRQYFSAELAQDAVAAALVAGVGNVAFVYNTTQDGANRIDASVTLDGVGITSVSADTAPALGGNLTLSGHNITGTGNINIVGSVTATSFGTVVTNLLSSSNVTSPDPGIISDHVLAYGTAATPVTLWGYSANTHAVWTGLTNTADTNTAFYARQSRGTLTAPTAVHPGDIIYRVNAQGFDGTSYSTLVGFGCQVDPDGTVTTGKVPGKFVITTYDSTGVAHYTTVNSKGVLAAPVVQTGSYTSTERDALTFAVGMMIYNTTTNKFQGYQNTGGITPEWVDLS